MPSSYLYLNDLRLHYLHWNPEGEGCPVILLHGLASNARIWELVAPYLEDGGMHVLAPDARGHGQTDKPEKGYNFETFYRDLLAFMDALDLQRPVLVGHSWGAGLALDYAARLPVGRRAPAGIVLVDGGLTQLDRIPGATQESVRRMLEPPRLAGMPVEAFLQRLQVPGGKWQPDDDAIQIILANFEVSTEERISPRLSYEHHMQIVDAMWEFKTHDLYSRVHCPVLLVPARPAEPLSDRAREFLQSKEAGARLFLERSPHTQVAWMEDSVHDIPLQRPAELARLILDFARQVDGSG
jgi:pimeloyl-ACP methyl ester carboxylesterase